MSENRMTIDGRQLTFTPGETILEVARRNGIFIPTLCHLKGASPTGACRVCVVEVEGGRALFPACVTPAAKNQVVHTASPDVLEARRTIVALLLQAGNHNCAIAERDAAGWMGLQQQVEKYDQTDALCPAHSACKLQALAYRYQVDPAGLVRLKPRYPMEMASPLIVRDFSRCILCGRCVQACNEIQVNNAISHGYRGAKAKIVAMGDGGLERSDCVFCGECVQACPVAALTEKKARYSIRPWEARHVRTTCHYCGVGCQLDLHIKDNRVMKATGVQDTRPNLGRLCVKGRFGFDFLTTSERLTQPLVRENGKLREASWDEALDRVVSKIREVLKDDGPGAIAGIGSAKSTNESLYLMQKLFRAVIGSPNVVSPFAASGLNLPLGDMEKARRILLIGSDITEENPVAGTFIKRAAKAGAALLVVDSRPTKIAAFATTPLLVREGTESVLVNGWIRELLERGRKGPAGTAEIAASFPGDKVLQTTGISAEAFKAAVDTLDTNEPVMLVYGPRVAPFADAFLRLQGLLGNLWRACGGVNALGALNNSQGASDMGLRPGALPGYARIDDPGARKRFEAAWGCTLSDRPGLSFPQLIRAMAGNGPSGDGRVRFLYCVGENPAITQPVLPDVIKALKALDFLVVQDNLRTETLEYAHVVLPSAAWVEDDGTTTNCERRVSRVRRAVPAPGQARPETWIFSEIARRLGAPWSDQTPRDIWEKEITALVPALSGMTYSRMEEDGGMVWPLPPPTDAASLDGASAFLAAPQWAAFNYHHRTLLEQCEGLIETLSAAGGIGRRSAPSDPAEVTAQFIKTLEEEEKLSVKPKIDEILAAYRPKKGGLIPVLQQIQEILGFLPVTVQNYIALGLGLPASEVYGVTTFYSFFTMIPRGRHVIRICLGTACFVKGSAKLLEQLQRHLKVDTGATTVDREFSLDVVRCLGACGLAPVMVIDNVTHGQLAASDIVGIVESYRGVPKEG
jgi:predicted molibdopterin-dependent oxidoreductase YjgC/NADH:ubiquinone oxidoreductase subunit E